MRPEIDYFGPGDVPATARKRLKGGRNPPTASHNHAAYSFEQFQEADADGAVDVPLGCRNCGADIGWRQRGAAGGPQLLQGFGSGDGN